MYVGHARVPLRFSISTKFKFSRQISVKPFPRKISRKPVQREQIFSTRAGRRTGMTQVIVAFNDFANAPNTTINVNSVDLLNVWRP